MYEFRILSTEPFFYRNGVPRVLIFVLDTWNIKLNISLGVFGVLLRFDLDRVLRFNKIVI